MLMGLKPVSQVLSEAGVVIFTPKLRKIGDESVIEANTKLREVAKNTSSGSRSSTSSRRAWAGTPTTSPCSRSRPG